MFAWRGVERGRRYNLLSIFVLRGLGLEMNRRHGSCIIITVVMDIGAMFTEDRL